MEQYAKAVVLEAAEPVTAALHLLHAQVETFRGAVRRAGLVMLEDLGAPRRERSTERANLIDVIIRALRAAGD